MILQEYIKAEYAIHCTTLSEATHLTEIIDALGYIWCDDQKYLDNTHYDTYAEQTCYLVSDGTYCDIDYFKEHNFKIIKYQDIYNLKHQITNRKIKELYKNNKL